MDEDGIHPMFVNVNMHTGQLATTWIDALQASFSAVQVLRGDIDEAICLHALYYSIWRKFGVLPERFNWQIKTPDVLFYPLRPEFIESTYFLYQATKNPFYLHVGRDILDNINTYTKVEYDSKQNKKLNFFSIKYIDVVLRLYMMFEIKHLKIVWNHFFLVKHANIYF